MDYKKHSFALFIPCYAWVSVVGKLYVCERWRPKDWEGLYCQPNHSEMSDPFLNREHPPGVNGAQYQHGFGGLKRLSDLILDMTCFFLFLLLASGSLQLLLRKLNCHFSYIFPNSVKITFYPVKWDFAIICSGLLQAEFGFLGKDLVFQGDAASWFQWSSNVF